ncbi:zinc finger BED domain-containing protein 4-like [Simochromis diagramma]|uniref:zinc finger BED domain-containing protein 4-like n=1 Tax=Simochromis diagramma TaxID=43689 RepID=UPI001A7E9B7D|nr:zinc finger BED domain-containing protein 4-like [Simochromis diagramma]
MLSCPAYLVLLTLSSWLFMRAFCHRGVLLMRWQLENSCKIVGHFKHSALASSRLKDIQLQVNQPARRLQQEVQTRWNSTFYMTQTLIEQKQALGIFVSEYGLTDTLMAHQWTLQEKVISVLGPFEELTRKVSSSDAMAADVIPAVTVLHRFLTRETDEDRGIKAMKGTLAAAVRMRFTDVEENPLYSIAMLLNLRYTNRFFSSTITAANAKEILKLELLRLPGDKQEDHDLNEPRKNQEKHAVTSPQLVWTACLMKLQMSRHQHRWAKLR